MVVVGLYFNGELMGVLIYFVIGNTINKVSVICETNFG